MTDDPLSGGRMLVWAVVIALAGLAVLAAVLVWWLAW